ncbi:TonB-dependent receptor [Termitidicoccus mucosus]|uniref:TonB-dependent receptor n=1 Tax=Termitidicoccus mucosus TaxID=1184151 RepID=A0A178IC79_9BACT|nr:hypothetical protein AW736_24985 [Opitutaceae bacterium TSB47]
MTTHKFLPALDRRQCIRCIAWSRPLAAVLAVLLCALPAVAQNAATGTVTGRVSNAATLKYLAGAEVVDRDSRQRAFTDTDGSFILVLPVGERAIVVNYGGLDSQTAAVTVTAGETVTRDIALTSADYGPRAAAAGEIIKLEAFVVSGEREGRMASIAQQKASDVLVNMISSDEFPNVAGANLGDFLRNIPGIDIMDSGNDPRDIMIRGMDSQMASVTSDGLRMANAGGTDGNSRAFNLDQISIQNYETIEVYKTPTAAMSADSGGGSINLVSKSAFNLKQRRISFQAGGVVNTENLRLGRRAGSTGDELSTRPVGNLYYANSFLNNRLGVVFTANYNDFYNVSSGMRHRRYSLYERSNYGGYLDDVLASGAETGIYSRDFNYGYDSGFTRRTSFSLNLDYKLTPSVKLYLNSQVNTSLIRTGRQTLALPGGERPSEAASEGGSTTGIAPDHWITNSQGYQIPVWSPYVTTVYTAGADIRANTVQDAANSKGAAVTTGLEVLNKIGRGSTFAGGMEYKRAGWKINLDAGVSLSTNHYTTQDGMAINSATAYLRGIDYRIDHAPGAAYPLITQLHGPDMYDLANYVSRVNSQSALVTVPGTGRDVPGEGGAGTVVIPGVSTNRTYPTVQMARGDYGPFQVSNGRWLSTKDKFSTLKLDARRSFFTRIPMYVQAGGLYREQERHTDKNGQSHWFFNGTTAELQDMLEKVKSPDLDATVGPYPPVPYFSLPHIDQYFREHPEKFTEDVVWRTETELGGDKFSRERVAGAYGMFNIRLGRFSALLGMRYERTDQYGRGPVANDDATAARASEMLMDYVRGYGYADITAAYNDTAINPLTGVSGQSLVTNYSVSQAQALELTRLRYANTAAVDKSYADWFPNVQLKYNLTANFIARASYNKSISRQPFDRLMPGYTVNVDSSGAYAIDMNNPSLKPIYHTNYDVALEYYMKGGGSASIGYYYKDVQNYTANVTETITENGVYDYDFRNYVGASLERPVNIGGQKNWGIEASFSQRLGFIHERLKNFSLYAAYTYQEGETNSSFNSTAPLTGLETMPKSMPAYRVVPRKLKLSLSYRGSRLNASVSYNWADSFYDGTMFRFFNDREPGKVDPAAFGYLWRDARGTFDAAMSYTFYRRYSFYVEAKNLTNEPFRTYLHNPNWTWEYQKYGAFVYFGIKGTF